MAGRLGGPNWAPLRRLVGFAGGTIVSWLLFNVNFCVWHLPALYDAALRWEFVHALEHFTFFATALLFWTRVVPAAPWRSSLSELGKLAYLTSTLVVGWMLAIVLALASTPLYSPYVEAASRPGHISALTDQQLAAGVMWVPGGLAYLIAIVVIAYQWLEPRESRQVGEAGGELLTRGVG
jgi:cytochrome c oxidase assembly factor CtaG